MTVSELIFYTFWPLSGDKRPDYQLYSQIPFLNCWRDIDNSAVVAHDSFELRERSTS